MNRLRDTFATLRRRHRAALLPFIMGGDPTLAATAHLVRALDEAGADVIEVGVPFSDPLADGPTIQRAADRALRAGTTPRALLRQLARLTPRLRAPLVLLTYWNPVLQYGSASGAAPEVFLRDAAQAGISGLIVPDLPLEEARTYRAAAARYGVASIFLATPTSPPARLREIARASRGFIYYVSVTGTTGARQQFAKDWLDGVARMKRLTNKPVCVGFGISTAAQARSVAAVADGVIVGSALIQAIDADRHGGPAAMATRARRFLTPLREALNR